MRNIYCVLTFLRKEKGEKINRISAPNCQENERIVNLCLLDCNVSEPIYRVLRTYLGKKKRETVKELERQY